MTVNEQNRLMNIIAPALRALLGRRNRLRLVSFSDSATDDQRALALEINPEASPGQIVEKLTAAIDAARVPVKAVCIKDLGVFAIVEGHSASGRVGGMVALVTGGAQGLGLGIAQDFVEQGAYVVLADMNEQGARRAADELCKTHGKSRAMGLAMDVSDGESVQKAINHVIRTYGGLDILVSNAGVLRAQSVKTQPVEDFDLVTAVNYRGYFLCVQKVAPILAVQMSRCFELPA